MFGGVRHDFIYAVIAGGAAFLTFDLVQRFIQIKFFSEFISATVVIAVAAFSLKMDGLSIRILLPLLASCH